MSVLLIPTAYLLLVLIFLCRPRNGLGESVLKAALAVMLAAVLSTEALSLHNWISRDALMVLWAAVNMLSLCVLYREIHWRRGWRRLRLKAARLRTAASLTPLTAFFATLLGIVFLLTLFSAVLQHPYDNDSICYHMPRVANWINRGSVEFYPTTNQRQNFYAPGSSYAVLHVQLL